MADCDVRIKRLLESIESGIAHELVAPRVRELQAERSRLEATLGVHHTWRPLSAREIAKLANSLGGVVLKCSSRRILRIAQLCTRNSA